MLNCAPVDIMPKELLENITYISPNEHEAHILTGIEVTDIDSAKNATKKLHKMGVKAALITMGSKGVVYSCGDTFLFSPAISGLSVKDTTAAGDSFMGAFCTAIAEGYPISYALAFANYTAAITVCRMGALPSLPTRAEVIEMQMDSFNRLR